MDYSTEQLQQRGIYTITNLLTGCMYVGKTGNSFEVRWKAHRAGLESTKHHNKALLLDWQAYGSDAFVFAIAEVLTSDDEMDYLAAERRHIEQCETETYNKIRVPLEIRRTLKPERTGRRIRCRIPRIMAEFNIQRLRSGLSVMSERRIAQETQISYGYLRRLTREETEIYQLPEMARLMQFFKLNSFDQLFEYTEEPMGKE